MTALRQNELKGIFFPLHFLPFALTILNKPAGENRAMSSKLLLQWISVRFSAFQAYNMHVHRKTVLMCVEAGIARKMYV